MPSTSHRLAPLATLALLAGASPALAATPANPHEDEVRRAAGTFTALEKADVDKLSKALEHLVQDKAILAPFLKRDRKKLLAVAKPSFEMMKTEDQITHWYFIEADGTCFLRVHRPEQFGDVITRDTFTQAVRTGDVGFGMELGKTAFALRVVRPIQADGKVLGYMELGEEIDHFFDRMKKETGDDFGLLVDKQHVDRKELARVRNDDRWDERPDVVLINSTMWDEKRIQLGMPLAKLPAAGVFVAEWRDDPRRYVGGAYPVKNAAGHVVGALFVRHRIDGRPGVTVPASTAK
jgi:hypothetical protein